MIEREALEQVEALINEWADRVRAGLPDDPEACAAHPDRELVKRLDVFGYAVEDLIDELILREAKTSPAAPPEPSPTPIGPSSTDDSPLSPNEAAQLITAAEAAKIPFPIPPEMLAQMTPEIWAQSFKLVLHFTQIPPRIFRDFLVHQNIATFKQAVEAVTDLPKIELGVRRALDYMHRRESKLSGALTPEEIEKMIREKP